MFCSECPKILLIFQITVTRKVLFIIISSPKPYVRRGSDGGLHRCARAVGSV